MKLFKKVTLVLTTALTLSACSKSSNDSSSYVAPAPNLNTESCAFEANEGNVASLEVTIPNIMAASFNKQYDHSLFKGVLSTSVEETIRFISETGAVVYQAPQASTTFCSRDLMKTAKIPPSDIRNRWDKSAGRVGPESVLLGLYLPKNEMPATADKAAILVRLNTNRWTLVHEYLHHLFTSEAQKRGYSDKTMFAELDSVDAEFNRINKSTASSQEKVEAFGNLLPRYVEAYDQFLTHFYLEETTIEKLMKDEHSNNQLRYAPVSDNGYLNGSAKKATAEYQDIKKFAETLYSAETRAEARALVKAQIDKINLRLKEISKIQASYPAHAQPISFGSETESHVGCEHNKAADDFLKNRGPQTLNF